MSLKAQSRNGLRLITPTGTLLWCSTMSSYSPLYRSNLICGGRMLRWLWAFPRRENGQLHRKCMENQCTFLCSVFSVSSLVCDSVHTYTHLKSVESLSYTLIYTLAREAAGPERLWSRGNPSWQASSYVFVSGTPWVRTNQSPFRSNLSVLDGDGQMVHPITCQLTFVSTIPFPNRVQGQLPRWFCVTNHLPRQATLRPQQSPIGHWVLYLWAAVVAGYTPKQRLEKRRLMFKRETYPG